MTELHDLDGAEAPFYSRREASRVATEAGFETAYSTLGKLACLGGGPRFLLFGRKPIYPHNWLFDWLRSRCRVTGGGHGRRAA